MSKESSSETPANLSLPDAGSWADPWTSLQLGELKYSSTNRAHPEISKFIATELTHILFFFKSLLVKLCLIFHVLCIALSLPFFSLIRLARVLSILLVFQINNN